MSNWVKLSKAIVKCHSFALRSVGGKVWLVGAVVSLIVFIIGLVVLLHPGFVGSTFGILTGIGLLVNGLSG